MNRQAKNLMKWTKVLASNSKGMLKFGSHEIFENVCHVERKVYLDFPMSNLEILKSVKIGNLVGKCD